MPNIPDDGSDGVRVTFTWGHIDKMERCATTGLAVHFCSHCLDHTSGDRTDRSGIAGGSDRPFHRG